MPPSEFEELSEFVLEKAGSSYRTAFAYDADGWEPVYIRSDLVTEELQELLPDLVERVRGAGPWVREAEYSRFGAHTASMEIHEEGVLLHFPRDADSGILVSLDHEVARNLTSFVTDCESIIH